MSFSAFLMGVTEMERGLHVRVAGGGAFLNMLLYRRGEKEPFLRIPFPAEQRVGSVWRLELPYSRLLEAGVTKEELKAAEYHFEGESGIFPDPWGKAYSGRDAWGDFSQYGRPLRSPLFSEPFDWKGDRSPGIPLCDSVIYRLHVRGFTMGRGSGVVRRGTFAGIAEKLPYLKELGVTAIELMPAQEFEELIPERKGGAPGEFGPELPPEAGKGGRINYWGYTGAHHFAPKASYCGERGRNPAGEFCTLVRECHRAGIEVIPELYFDGDEDGAYVLEVLRYYVETFHVDGIHLSGRVNTELAAADPYLSGIKLIAERWGAESGRSGASLAFCNEDFLREMRCLIKGDEGMVKALCFHIGNHPEGALPIHFFANTNGFTMMDMVSYDVKHNEENGEENRDGPERNFSWNCGAEGATRSKKIRSLRRRQLRNAFLLLFLCQGTPLFLAGDEFGNSQKGNNNAYCQDNMISWLDWRKLKTERELFEFVKCCIRFRKRHRALHMERGPLYMDPEGRGMPDLSYHGTRAWQPEFEPWRRQLGVLYSGAYARDEAGNEDASLYVMYNMHWEAHSFALPHPEKGSAWRLAAATAEAAEPFSPEGQEPLLEDQQLYRLEARSIAVLIARAVPGGEKAKRPAGRRSLRADAPE